MRAKLERVIAVVLLGGALLPALLAAWCLRLPGICSTVLAAYVLLVAEITAITTVLSAVRVVTPLGIAVAELLLLALAGSLWLRNNRPPVPSPATARAAVAALARDPVTVTLAAVVAIALIYELMLVLTVPPNDWDSLTYHLARVAAWVNHHGIYWIPHAPTDRMNEFQPIAEQQILFNFVATGKGALFALPQFIGQLAILAAIFVTARRLGYQLRLAACAALFFATLPIVALEATTAQNNLVAASLGCAAAAFLFGPTRREVALAGGSAALALGVKLSHGSCASDAHRPRVPPRTHTVQSLWCECGRRIHRPSNVGIRAERRRDWSCTRGGRRPRRAQCRPVDYGTPLDRVSGAVPLPRPLGIQPLDDRGHNPRRTSRSLFRNSARVERASRTTASRPNGRASRAGSSARADYRAAACAGSASVGRAVTLPVNNPRFTSGSGFSWEVNTRAFEDYSYFGAVGGLVAIGIPLLALWEVRGGRVDRRALVLAVGLPVYIALFALTAKYNEWVSRFMLAPVALTAPLSHLFSGGV